MNEQTNPNETTKEVVITNASEAQAIREITQISPATQANEFINRISKIQDSGMYEKYYKQHEGLVAQLTTANKDMPAAVTEPKWWQKIIMIIPVIGPKIATGIKDAQFKQAGSIEKVQKLLFELDQSYVVLRNDVKPTRELMAEIQTESKNIQEQIGKLEAFRSSNQLSPEATEFMEKYINTQKMSVEEMDHTFVPWLQEVVNQSEKLYLNYVIERKAIATSLITTVKILQRVGVVQVAADSIKVMRELKGSAKLLAANALATMRTSVAEVEGSLMHTLQEFSDIKNIDEKSIEDAKTIKAKGQEEMKKLMEQKEKFRLRNNGDLNQVKAILPGGEQLVTSIEAPII